MGLAFTFGTAEWADALRDEINASSEYRNAANEWGLEFNGNMLFVFEADEKLQRPLNLLIRLRGGRCEGAEFVSEPRHADAGFTLRATFSLWKDVLARRTLAATAILMGKMHVDGAKMTLLKHTSANRALVHCTASVDTIFPGT
jgi:putative sterol carrier protein